MVPWPSIDAVMYFEQGGCDFFVVATAEVMTVPRARFYKNFNI